MKKRNFMIVSTLVLLVILLAEPTLRNVQASAADKNAPISPNLTNPVSQSGFMKTATEATPVRFIAMPGNDFTRIRPRFEASAIESPTAAFTINYLAAGTPDDQGATCLAWNATAQAAFTYAASVWAKLINSNVPIRINACWANLGSSTTLGYAWSNIASDFGSGQSGTWYTYALADSMVGYDLDPSNPDFYITYNNVYAWYLGTDGNTPAGYYDFVTVVMHEIAHGLNFSGTMRRTIDYCITANYGCWGYLTGLPNIYDRFIENGAGQSLLNTALYPNPSLALGLQLVSGNLYFNGPNANAANGGSRVKIYSPAMWVSGTSYSHLDYATFGTTVNRLMISSVFAGTSIHDPGGVGIGLLTDLGWKPTFLVDDDFTTSTFGWGQTHFASIQNGINAVPSGGTVMVADGTYNESVTLSKTANVVLENNITINGNLTIGAGAWNSTNATLSLSGNLTHSGGTFNPSTGSVNFNGGGVQTITGDTAFYNITVGSAVTLTTSSNVTLGGTLTNNGWTKETKTISGAGAISYGLARTTANVTTRGGLTSLQFIRRDQNHPNATGTPGSSGTATGKWWRITTNTGASGYTVNLTLPHSGLTEPEVCKWPGGLGGAGWDCSSNGFDANTVWRNGIQSFSDWAVGQHVEPTAISLDRLKATSPGSWLPLGLLALAAFGGLWAIAPQRRK